MNDFPIIFASLDELRDQIILGLRIGACAAAAVAGWFVAGPIFRILYRVFSPRKGIPGATLFGLRLASAAALGGTAFLFVHFGLGGGGNGWFGGSGAGPGKGKGDGDGKGSLQGSNQPSNTMPGKNAGAFSNSEKRIEIEIVSDEDKNEDKNYVVKHNDLSKDPARTIKELKQYLTDKNVTEIRIFYPGKTPEQIVEEVETLCKTDLKIPIVNSVRIK